MPAAAARPAAYRKCGQNEFTGTLAHTAVSTDEATVAWYSNSNKYDVAAGRAKAASEGGQKEWQQAAYKFTRIVWKGVATKQVGFGVKGTRVVAWYCPSGNTPDDATSFKANVCEAGCPAECITDTVNTCYNNNQIRRHNEFRTFHGSPNLVFDQDTAKAAQTMLAKVATVA